MVSAGVRGDVGVPFIGRLMGWAIGRSMGFGRDMRPAGVIFSKP